MPHRKYLKINTSKNKLVTLQIYINISVYRVNTQVNCQNIK